MTKKIFYFIIIALALSACTRNYTKIRGFLTPHVDYYVYKSKNISTQNSKVRITFFGVEQRDSSTVAKITWQVLQKGSGALYFYFAEPKSKNSFYLMANNKKYRLLKSPSKMIVEHDEAGIISLHFEKITRLGKITQLDLHEGNTNLQANWTITDCRITSKDGQNG